MNVSILVSNDKSESLKFNKLFILIKRIFNPADDYQNTNFVGEFNTRDEIDFTPMKDGNRFDLNFNAEFCSRKQAAKGFYTLLRSSMTRSIKIKQKHPFAPIYIMKI